MKYFSLFSGIGGFEIGIQNAFQNILHTNKRQHEAKGSIRRKRGLESDRQERLGNPVCVGFSEIDKYATQIYQKHFPTHKNYGDITKIDERGLPDFDLLCGGFPCQSFSIAGRRGGFEDTRGTLFFDIARIAKHKRPRIIFLENVKGLLSHDRGRTFNTIIATLEELGYDLQWQVLNSKNFGVPQNRERVFIIGHLRGTPQPKVFPITKTDRENTKSSKKRSGKHSQTVTSQGGLNARGTFVDTSYTIDANYAKGTNTLEKSRRQLIQVNQPVHSNDRVYDPAGLSPTLNTMQGGNRQPFIQDEVRIRRLTPKECERLQGFMDGWTYGLSDTQRYKCLGNAVTVNVIQAIMERLVDNHIGQPVGDRV